MSWPAWGWTLLAAGIGSLLALGRHEVRRRGTRVAPLLRPGLLRIPAFSAGLGVMAAFAAGLQGFFLILAVWLQGGMGFSPLRAGLTALAFSAGSFALAPMAVPLARTHGRLVLFAGGVLMALGIFGVRVGAAHVHSATRFWPLVPGLAVAGVGLSLLIIPVANVVLAAVPRQAAGGAGGTFSTVQQIGGARRPTRSLVWLFRGADRIPVATLTADFGLLARPAPSTASTFRSPQHRRARGTR